MKQNRVTRGDWEDTVGLVNDLLAGDGVKVRSYKHDGTGRITISAVEKDMVKLFETGASIVRKGAALAKLLGPYGFSVFAHFDCGAYSDFTVDLDFTEPEDDDTARAEEETGTDNEDPAL